MLITLSDIELPSERPIVLLIAFNRPNLLKQTLNALEKQSVLPSKIVCYIDGPRNDADQKNISACVAVASKFRGCEIIITCREKNLGCNQNILESLKATMQTHSQVIYLEDDTVPAPYYYEVMTKLLDHYKDSQNIFCINGFLSPGYKQAFLERLEDSFFGGNRFCPYGFATWSNRWSDSFFEKLRIKAYMPYKSCWHIPKLAHFRSLIDMQQHNKINHPEEWALSAIFTLLYEKKLIVSPSFSMIKNIGFGHPEAVNTIHPNNAANKHYKDHLDPRYISFPLSLDIEKELLMPIGFLSRRKMDLRLLLTASRLHLQKWRQRTSL